MESNDYSYELKLLQYEMDGCSMCVVLIDRSEKADDIETCAREQDDQNLSGK